MALNTHLWIMSMKRVPRKKYKNIDDYLASIPTKERTALENLRRTIKVAAPKAEEAISYQIPAFIYRGPLVFFAAFKDHCSFFVGSKSIMTKFRRELKIYDASGGTIHFLADKPLPATLVTKIVKARIKENEARSKGRKKTND